MKADKLTKLKKVFLETKFVESEEIELDNLDRACLILTQDKKGVEVWNEHGTTFPISDLSEVEIDIFLYLLQN